MILVADYIVILFMVLMGGVFYGMWRWFTDAIEGVSCELRRYIDETRNRCGFLEQKIKDGIQSNTICYKSALDKMRSDITKMSTHLAAIQHHAQTVENNKPDLKKEK